MSTTASINAKGTNNTGITEDLVKSLHDNLGKSVVAVVEIRSESRVENLGGDEKVNLVIQTLEPATTPEAEDYLRQFSRSLHTERKLHSDGETLDIQTGDDLEPKVADVIAAGAAMTPHEFDVDPDDPEKCSVCGQDDYADVHQTPETPDDDQGDDPAPAEEDAGDLVDA